VSDGIGVGCTVSSIKVGAKDAFIGRVVGLHPGTRLAFVVRDLNDGTEWYREPRHLKREGAS
jgi:hypothetical protein